VSTIFYLNELNYACFKTLLNPADMHASVIVSCNGDEKQEQSNHSM